jgi:hypothetical protein
MTRFSFALLLALSCHACDDAAPDPTGLDAAPADAPDAPLDAPADAAPDAPPLALLDAALDG